MSPIVFMIAAALTGAPQFEAQSIGGDTVVGELFSLDANLLGLRTPTGIVALPLRDLLQARVKSDEKPAAGRSAVCVELTDGSRLMATDFQVTKGVATISLSAENSIALPTRAIRWVRFVDTTETADQIDAAWREFAAHTPAGDLLVVRKKGSIDSTEGLVGDITSEAVIFTLDGEGIHVKRPKIEGIVFARPAGNEFPESDLILVDNAGSHYHAASLKLVDDAIQLTTPAGLKTAVRLANVTQLDFSSGKIQYLSDLDPESFAFQPFFAPAENLPALTEFYRLRRDIGLENQPLRLDGRAYRKGIALYSRSTVVYRLPGKFRNFTATAGIDDAVRASGGDVKLEILGDGKSLWTGHVRGAEQPQSINVEITGVKRLEIVADYGDRQDVADHLDLCEAKVSK
jgi:hypothetical protein